MAASASQGAHAAASHAGQVLAAGAAAAAVALSPSFASAAAAAAAELHSVQKTGRPAGVVGCKSLAGSRKAGTSSSAA